MGTVGGSWLTTWDEVLAALPSLHRGAMVSFDGAPATAQDGCLVSDSMALGDADDVPAQAAQRGWHDSLLKEQIEDVIGNLRAQVGEPGRELILRAIAHYVDNDAFLAID